MNWAERKTFPGKRPVRFLHVSSQIVRLPLLGVNGAVDHEVALGLYRDVVLAGEFRLARTKGVTYRKPKP